VSDTDKQIAALSIGLKGRPTQDAHYAQRRTDGSIVLAIADGVGGSSDGRRAATLAIDELAQWAASESTNLSLPFKSSDESLRRIVEVEKDIASLTTTLTAVVISEDEATYGHVGDCRIYHLRGNGLRTVTHDQTEVAQLIAEGILSKRQARSYRRSNVLVSALGSTSTYQFDAGTFSVAPGDRIVMCSDGVYKSLTKQALVSMSLASASAVELRDRVNAYFQQTAPSDDATLLALDI